MAATTQFCKGACSSMLSGPVEKTVASRCATTSSREKTSEHVGQALDTNYAALGVERCS